MTKFRLQRPHKRQLSTPQLILCAATLFAATVLGGLYGPALASRLKAAAPIRFAGPPSARFDTYYRNCRAAHAAGVYSIPRGAPGYRASLDGDNDGWACEPYYGG